MSTPAENALRKATPIARHAWRHGLTHADLLALPYASRDRHAATRSRFAREAFKDAGVTENTPSEHGGTWSVVAQKLASMDQRVAAGLPAPARDLTDQAGQWKPAAADPDHAATDRKPPPPAAATPPSESPHPAGTSSDAAPPDAGTTSTTTTPAAPAPSPDAPAPTARGWAELAAHAEPLPYGACIHHPDRRPIIITPDGGRCADCPPIPAEFDTGLARRDGWGCTRLSRLNGPQPINWAPTPQRKEPAA